MTRKLFRIVWDGNIILHHSPSEREKIKPDRKIDRIWNKEIEKKKEKLFDGQVLTCTKIHKKHDKIILDGKFIRYRFILAQRIDPTLGLNIKQIGVSGITFVIENRRKYILFAKRNPITTEYANHLELVPSGNIDKSALRENNTIDYQSKIIEEFIEETGLSKKKIRSCQSFCLVFDKKNNVFDVCCIININTTRRSIIRHFSKSTEYRTPKFVSIYELREFIDKNKNNLVPTSLAILEYFLIKK